MRSFALCALLVAAACKPGGVSATQVECANAAAMFEQCEDFGMVKPIERDLMVDRWRGLCRAVLVGETAQLAANTREVFEALDDGERALLAQHAACMAWAPTCSWYANCER
jgi:hypothetical protein